MTFINWSFVGWSLAVVLCLAALLGFWLYLRRRLRVDETAQKSAIERVLASNGAACCMETITLLRDLTKRGNEQEFATTWMRISIHLEAVLPHCPPELRKVLGQQLDMAAKSCSLRSVAKAMSDCAAHC